MQRTDNKSIIQTEDKKINNPKKTANNSNKNFITVENLMTILIKKLLNY
jgi:hypothetical protein